MIVATPDTIYELITSYYTRHYRQRSIVSIVLAIKKMRQIHIHKNRNKRATGACIIALFRTYSNHLRVYMKEDAYEYAFKFNVFVGKSTTVVLLVYLANCKEIIILKSDNRCETAFSNEKLWEKLAL